MKILALPRSFFSQGTSCDLHFASMRAIEKYGGRTVCNRSVGLGVNDILFSSNGVWGGCRCVRIDFCLKVMNIS